jgi:aerobic C4-dicarboxylate transport protein
VTNVVGNGVATIVVSRWEKELEGKKMADLRRIMASRNVAVREPKPEELKPDELKSVASKIP